MYSLHYVSMHSSIYLYRCINRCIHTYPYVYICVVLITYAFISFSNNYVGGFHENLVTFWDSKMTDFLLV